MSESNVKECTEMAVKTLARLMDAYDPASAIKGYCLALSMSVAEQENHEEAINHIVNLMRLGLKEFAEG